MSYRDDLTAARDRRDALRRELDDVRGRLGDRDALEAQARRLDVELLEASKRVDHARARAPLPVLQDLRVASPCSERWDAMTGDERVRHCGRCDKDVFDLSALTTAEAEALLTSRGSSMCVRFFRRVDGTVMTSDCPEGARRQRKQRVAQAGAAVAISSVLLGAGVRFLGPRFSRWFFDDKAERHPREVVGAIEARPYEPPPPMMGIPAPRREAPPPATDPPATEPLAPQ